MSAALVSRVDVERFFRETGGEVQEVPRLTREVLIPRDGRAPLILVPAGMPSLARRRAIAAALMLTILDKVDWESAVQCWRSSFQIGHHARPQGGD